MKVLYALFGLLAFVLLAVIFGPATAGAFVLAPAPLATIKDWRAKRAKLAADARAILDEAKDGALSDEQQQRWDDAMTEIDSLGARIQQEERLHDVESELNQPGEVRSQNGQTNIVSADERKANEDRYSQAFGRAIRGMATSEDRAMITSRVEQLPPEARALGVATGAAGGFTVPEEFLRQIEQALKAFGGMREAGTTIIRTSSGAEMPFPTSNDTANEGAIIGENTQIAEQDTTFAQVVFKSYMYTSKIIRVSFQLLQDSAFNLEEHLAGILGTRVARITNKHFTIGTNSDQPQGVATAAAEGTTAGAGQATTVTPADLVDLEHSVDPAYRRDSRWMFHDSTLKALKKLDDDNGRPLWLPGLAVREPDTILSRPYTINQDVAEMAAGARSILFGDFSKYYVRDVVGFNLIVMREKYADFLQIGFLGYSRHDGRLVDAGTGPVRYYRNTPA